MVTMSNLPVTHKGYFFLDSNDTFGGCRPDFKLPTSNKDVGYRLERLPMINWPMRDYDLLSPFTEDDCKNTCLNDYLCVASILNDQTCWKKGLPLINGRVDASRTVFLKVSDVDDDGNNSQLLTPATPNLRRKWKDLEEASLIMCIKHTYLIYFYNLHLP
ncbi:hypothetical protein V2J09_014141 [Rumex salicifolius]